MIYFYRWLLILIGLASFGYLISHPYFTPTPYILSLAGIIVSMVGTGYEIHRTNNSH